MSRATIRRPGDLLGPVHGPDVRNRSDAIQWAAGYCKPAPALPAGTVVFVDGVPYAVPVYDARTKQNRLRLIGRV